MISTGLGCQHIGPQSIVTDRLAYNRTILASWEEQTLLNIVRVRYHDLVNFVDVSSVTQQHSLMGSISAALGAAIPLLNVSTSSLSPNLSGARSTSDTPSIVYTPLTGADFTRNLNAPLTPVAIFNLVESGYKADVFLDMTLYSINGIPNADPSVDPNFTVKRYSLFIKLMQAIECAYRHGDLSFYVQPGSDTQSAKVFMLIEDEDSKLCPRTPKYYGPISPVGFIRENLHLKAAETKFEIVEESRARNENEIAVRTRSAIAVMRWLSSYVNVPKTHLEARLADLKELPDDGADRPLDVQWTIRRPRPRDAFAVHVRTTGFQFDRKTTPVPALIYLRLPG